MREVHLPGFAAAVGAGVATLMPAFTDLNGVPMTAHVPLLRDWLRGEMGFDGVIVSDYNAIAELIDHGVAADLVDAAVLALKAGVDIDMMADAYRNGLPIALEQGRVTIARDRRVRAPRVAAQGAARPVRRPLPARRDTGERGGDRRAACAGARRRVARPWSC